MIVREFTTAGSEAFRAWLGQCRHNGALPLPRELLEDEALAQLVHPNVVVEPRRFATKGDAAQYLQERLEPLEASYLRLSAGLWTWLTLFYFDEVCPLREGVRRVRVDHAYVFESRSSRKFYRHLLFSTWYASVLAGPHARLYLWAPLPSSDEITNRVMSRLFLTRIPCIFEVLDRLYWDANRGRARAGILEPREVRPGDLRHRFPTRIRQLEKTYDLQSVTADQLLELLGPEFQEMSGVARHDG